MRRVGLTSTTALAVLALLSVPAFGQSESGSRRGGGGGERTGTAAPRNGGDSGRHGGSSSGGSSTSSSAPAPSAPSSGFTGGDRDRAVPRSAPERRHGPSSVDRSTRSRGRSSGSGGSEPNAVEPTRSASDPTRQSPEYARSRGDRPAIGSAVQRSEAPFPPGGYYPIYPGYPGGGFYYPGYWGFGAFYYDPWWWGGYGYPYGYAGHGGYGYGGYGGYGGSSSSYYDDYGKLRLKVKPREAHVYVDGYFSGVVDQFDGVFQNLTLRAGGHRVEIRADGYETLSFDVMIVPYEKVTYSGELRRAP
jgi:hypothetical protein